MRYGSESSRLIPESVSPSRSLSPSDPARVSQVSALHLSAELVVHYGPACLSPVTRLAVLYVFGTERLDTQKCAQALAW